MSTGFWDDGGTGGVDFLYELRRPDGCWAGNVVMGAVAEKGRQKRLATFDFLC